MAWYRYPPGFVDLEAFLVDGYLPPDGLLDELTSPFLESEFARHDSDSKFVILAERLRVSYCSDEHECKPFTYCGAWLLNPEGLQLPGFELHEEYVQGEMGHDDPARRRLLVAVYKHCSDGLSCLRNLVEKSSFLVIPKLCYKNFEKFQGESEALLFDIMTPFINPYGQASEKIQARGFKHKYIEW